MPTSNKNSIRVELSSILEELLMTNKKRTNSTNKTVPTIEANITDFASSIIERDTGKIHESEITTFTEKDFRALDKWKKSVFEWKNFLNQEGEIYKLTIKGKKELLGLLRAADRSDHVEILALESSPETRHGGKYRGVGSNLIAYAIKRSFELGYEGAISFIAKSSLIKFYEEKLGAQRVGNSQLMIIQGAAAKKLYQYYFEEKESDNNE